MTTLREELEKLAERFERASVSKIVDETYERALALAAANLALEAAARCCEVYLHNVPAEGGDDLDRIGRYSNGTVKRCAAAIRAMRVG